MTDSFLVSHSFLVLVLFSQKPLVDLPFWGVLGELTSISLTPMLPHLYLFRLSFLAAFLFCYFSQVSRILPCQVQGFPNYFPRGSSFWITQSTSLVLMSYCSPSPLVLCCITVCSRRTYLSFVSCYFWFPS